MSEPTANHTANAGESDVPRRGFLAKFLSVVIGGAITIIPLAIGKIFYLDPILRKRQTAGRREGEAPPPAEGFILVTNLASLPADGTPVNYRIVMDVVDAWNFYRDQPVGAVYLRKTAERDVSCFNQICPHLGCDVSYVVDAGTPCFKCPCHDSSFQLDGTPRNAIPPRPLDAMETTVTDNGDIWVKYVKYETATSELKPIV